MNPRTFRFKQFSVDDSMCAMKVGTDAVLLGVWVNIDHAATILDIGTGCGLIALMAAQRSKAKITAIDIDESASLQSKENFLASPWPERLVTVHGAVQQLNSANSFDLIICNPPFFKNALKAPDKQRNIARHNDELSFESLLVSVDRLLNNNGTFAFILPNDEAQQVITLAAAHQLYPNRCCNVLSREGKSSNRLLVELSHKESVIDRETLIIRDHNNQYTLQYKELTKDFYLFLTERAIEQ
jgi:tRNA1Val (adenine37-N6)-methyltransferase